MNFALITGATGGIGRVTARKFADKGYFVFLIGRNNSELLKLQKDLSQSMVLKCDLNSKEQIDSSVLEIKKKTHRLDVLVNNAGVFHNTHFENSLDEIWLEQFAVNLMAPVRLVRGLYPLLKEAKGSSVINISSSLGIKPTASTMAYSAIKAAVINWTISLAKDGAQFNIRANCICPGIVDTPMQQYETLMDDIKKQKKAEISSTILLGRIGRAEEIADAILFFASQSSAWTTGSVLTIDGGGRTNS